MTQQLLSWMVLLLVSLISSCHGARILGIIPMGAKSHNFVLSSLMRELAERGHQMTVLSFFPQETKKPNFTDITINSDFFKEMGNSRDMYEMNNMNSAEKIIMLWMMGGMFAETILEQPNVQELIHSKDQQFDLILIEAFFNEAFLGFTHKFKAPTIAICPFGGTHWMGYMVGNPSPFSYVPDVFLSYTDHMSFFERLHNAAVGMFGYLGHNLFYIPRQDAIMRKYFNSSGSLPHLSELTHSISALLVNAHISLSYPRPLVPNLVQVGGMHIKPAKTLPKDLQQYLDGAKYGVIYFSMGSALQSAKMPESKTSALFNTFAKLKQKVLWKWESDTQPELPANVKLSKWLPQAEILAHPNVQMFITHGGLLGTQEAIYNGVPLLGIPVFGDQELNMRKAEAAGYGLMLDYKNLTQESVEWAINEVLHQPSYRANAKRLSNIFRDQPETPMERAVYWVEYIIRHKGAPHLRSAALDLAWYQYLLLDVIVVILAVPALGLLLTYMGITALLKRIRSRTGKQQAEKKSSKKRN